MIRKLAPFAVAGIVAACSGGGNPLNFGGVVTPPPEEELPDAETPAPITGVQVPAVIAHNLRAATYEPGSPTVRIDLVALDGTPMNATYRREPSLDVSGFEAYTVQEGPNMRKFIALFRRAGQSAGGVVGDGGQYGTYFAGASYTNLQAFTLPTPAQIGPTGTLQAVYRGGYVGVLNTGTPLPAPGVVFPPSQSLRVTGELEMVADFNAENMSVNGGIANRSIVDTGAALGKVHLKVTQITPDGAFSGLIAYAEPGSDYDTALGHYSGAFGGTGAVSVAGGTKFNPVPGEAKLWEHGSFVGTR